MAGGQGGSTDSGLQGGLGATVKTTYVVLQAGAIVPIIVARQGGPPISQDGGGGGGLSAVYTNGLGALPTIVAGLILSLRATPACRIPTCRGEHACKGS